MCIFLVSTVPTASLRRTVVSPRLTLLEVVVTVRVTLQLVNAIAAIAAPAKKVNNLFIVLTDCVH